MHARMKNAWVWLSAVSGLLLNLCCFASASKTLELATEQLVDTDRARLAAALASQMQTVDLLMLAQPGAFRTLVASLESIQAQPRFESEELDYVRASVPIERVAAALRLPSIEHVNVDWWYSGKFVYSEATASPVLVGGEQFDLASITAQSGHVPIEDLGVASFLKRHPSWDGRGTSIGHIMEMAPDFSHPVLNHALTVGGERTQKVGLVDTDVSGELSRYFRVEIEPVVTTSGLWERDGRTYIAPGPGRYLHGVWSVAELTSSPFKGAYFAALFHRDGKAVSDVGVLVDERTGEIRLDLGNEGDFRGVAKVHDFNQSGQWFSLHPRGGTPGDEVPLAVTLIENRTRARFWFGNYDHSLAVASTAVANKFGGDSAHGVAPHARIVFFNPGHDGATVGGLARVVKTSAVIESFIIAARRPDIDVLTCSCGPWVRDTEGASVQTGVLNRIVRRLNKPVVAGAGNANPVGYVAAPGFEDVIAVGGAISSETLSALWQFPAHSERVLGIASTGPSADGNLKPDVVAPFCWLAAVPVSRLSSSGESNLQPSRFPHPYRPACGTSFSGPAIGAVLALMKSAALQQGMAFDAHAAKAAILHSARHIPNGAPVEQGHGIPNVGAAWELYREGLQAMCIEVSAALNHHGTARSRGLGLFEREGWSPGQSGQRVIKLVRRCGVDRPVAFDVRVHEPISTQTSTRIELPLNVQVDLPLVIGPVREGLNSAFVALLQDGREAARIPVTVVAGRSLTAQSPNASWSGRRQWLQWHRHFVSLPAYAEAFEVTLQASAASLELMVVGPGAQIAASLHSESGRKVRVSLPSPEPGTWELLIRRNDVQVADRVSHDWFDPIEYQLSASLESPPPQALASTMQIEYVTALTQAFEISGTAGMQVVNVEVRPGSELLEVSLGMHGLDDRRALYLMHCGDDPGCPGLTAFQAPALLLNQKGQRKHVVVPRPPPGRWMIVADTKWATSRSCLRVTEVNEQFAELAQRDPKAAAAMANCHDCSLERVLRPPLLDAAPGLTGAPSTEPIFSPGEWALGSLVRDRVRQLAGQGDCEVMARIPGTAID